MLHRIYLLILFTGIIDCYISSLIYLSLYTLYIACFSLKYNALYPLFPIPLHVVDFMIATNSNITSLQFGKAIIILLRL